MLDHLDLPRIVFMNGECKGQTYLLQEPELSVGRKSDNDVVIKDTSISRYHLLLIMNGKQVWLEDRSSHGSKVNGEPVSGRVPLLDRDVISFGLLKARVEIPEGFPTPGVAERAEPEVIGEAASDPGRAPSEGEAPPPPVLGESEELDPLAEPAEPSDPSIEPAVLAGEDPGVSNTFNLQKEATEQMNVPNVSSQHRAAPPPIMIPPRPDPYGGLVRGLVIGMLSLLVIFTGVIAFKQPGQTEWEYRMLRVAADTSLEAELNRLGALGWELVESDVDETRGGLLVLKRAAKGN